MPVSAAEIGDGLLVGGEGAEEWVAMADGAAVAVAEAAEEGLGLWVVLIDTGGWPQAASNAATDTNQAARRISRGQL